MLFAIINDRLPDSVSGFADLTLLNQRYSFARRRHTKIHIKENMTVLTGQKSII
jgi:hypothetical protein